MRKVLYTLLLLVVVVWSCKEPQNQSGQNFDRGAMLDNMGDNIIVPSYNLASQSAVQLNLQFQSFKNLPDSNELEKLKLQFKSTYKNWQAVSPYEFGPAANVGLRARLNTFPANTQKIETAISTDSWNLDQLSFSDAIGFPSVDYLLFSAAADVTLASFTTSIFAMERMEFLKDLIADIDSKLVQVKNGWDPAQGNYLTQFKSNKGTDIGSGTSLLINAINQHFERYLRDGKIGIPVGIRSLGIAIPEKCEAYYSGVSLQLALLNMDAIERMYKGKHLQDDTDGLGLDDYLKQTESADVHANISQQMQTAYNDLSALSDPLSDQIINNQSAVEDAYTELQKLIILLKVDMPSNLGVLITYQDNDGD